MSDLVAPEIDDVAPQRGSLHIFRYRNFALFFSAAAISNAGGWMQLIAVQALMYKLTGRGSWLGASTVASLVPGVLLTPYAGVLADRISRQTILKVTQSLQMIVAAAMWVIYVHGSITPWWIVVLSLMNGVAVGFQTAAWQSFVPLLVPPHEILHAVRLNSTQYTVARAVGPAIGGIVVAISGIGSAIACNAITYLLVIGVLFAVEPRVHATPSRGEGIWAGLVDGARYTWSRPRLRLAVLLGLAVSMLGQSIQYIASALSERLFNHSAEGNAGLLSSFGVGSLLSAGVTVVYGNRLRRPGQVFAGLSLYAFSVTLLPLTHSYAVGMLAYFLAGCGHLLVVVALNTMLQGSVPDEYRGRVTSFYILGILGGIPIGSQLLGSLGDVIGFRRTLLVDAFAFGAVLATLVISGWWRALDESTPETQ